MSSGPASKLIFGNRQSFLGKSVADFDEEFNYIVLSESNSCRTAAEYLKSLEAGNELPAANLIRRRNIEFGKQYVEFLGQLNQENHSLAWWAMTFTDRNPSAPGLCRDILHFDLIAELIHRDSRPLVVITDSPSLGLQLKAWARIKKISVNGFIQRPWSLIRLLKEHSPSGHVLALYKTLTYWIHGRRFRPSKGLVDGWPVITTLVHTRSFTDNGIYKDVYFEPLLKRAAESGKKLLVFGLMMENPPNLFRKLRSLSSELCVVPLESCLSLGSIVKCALKSLRIYYQPVTLRGSTEFNGNDIALLLQSAVRKEQRSGNLFMNLRMYYAARTLSNVVRPKRWLYLYENLVWEKMMLLGGRSKSHMPYMVGYQHSSITLSHLDFTLAKNEAEFMPLPDEVLTPGKITKAWLEDNGNYPIGMIKNACALRQNIDFDTRRQMRRTPLKNILVALATSTQEYLNSLTFLESAAGELKEHNLKIRPHPVIPLLTAIRGTRFESNQFYTEDIGPLDEALEWADVVIYASSTVGLEAISKGIPAIYLNLGTFLDTDPMHGWNEMKWSVQSPAELATTIKGIGAIPTDEFVARQKNGQEYILAYLQPITEESIQQFWGN